ncbi:endolytic transglycosylase MltG [Luteococcus peritonei]|uniref:Endolytic murein transglycosylase n=1 Tax=Luteococcus peritonei TaxID=88874 RepID=A0ABW4RZ39_9ACTN
MSSLFSDDDGKTDWQKVGYHGRSAFAVLLSLAVLVGGGWFAASKAHDAYMSWRTADNYIGQSDSPVTITIPNGATGTAMGDLLVKNDVVKSRKAFLKALAANDDSDKIQAGTYQMFKQMSADAAVARLLDPKAQLRNQVTVPEGMWQSDIFALLSKRTKIPVAQFQAAAKNPKALGYPAYVKNTEGYLFPETYEMGQKPTATSILKLMAAQYKQVAEQNDLVGRAKEMDLEPNEVMTVASILEAEAKAKDMPMVAGIIYNRLENGTPLGLDSTAHYQLKIPMNKPLPSGFQDKGTDSSYNTYANTGLPDGPISSPGEAAIKAALNPTESDYQYWLTVNFATGETKFAETLDEHNKNLREWEAWCKTAKDKSGCPA